MVVAGIFVLLFLLILGLLLTPLEIYINTTTKQYYLQLRGLARASLEGHETEIVRIRLRVLFRNFYFYPLKKTGRIKKKKMEKGKVKKRRRRMTPRRIFRLLKSFRIKKLLVDIDTGNCISNSKLYPVFTFLDYHIGRFNINFEGRNQVVLSVYNRPLYIIKSFINP